MAITVEQLAATMRQLAEGQAVILGRLETSDTQSKAFLRGENGGGGKGKSGGKSRKEDGRREENLGGRTFDMFKTFSGGEPSGANGRWN